MKSSLLNTITAALLLTASALTAAPAVIKTNSTTTNTGATLATEKMDTMSREKRKKNNSYSGKKMQAASKYYSDDPYLIVATLPNNTGSIDSYLSARLFLSKRWVSWIEFESTTAKTTRQELETSPFMLITDYIMDKNYKLRADLIKYRFINSRSGKNRKFIMDIGIHTGYDYSSNEVRYADMYEDGDEVFFSQAKYTMSFAQGHLKLSMLFVNGKKTLLHLYGGAGVFYGKVGQKFVVYTSSTNYSTKEAYNLDTDFISPGITAGANIYHNFGPISIGVSGSLNFSKGDIDLLEYDSTSAMYYSSTSTLRYFNWNLKMELGLKFIKIGNLSPSLIYSMSQTRFDVDFGYGYENLVAQYSDNAEEIGIVHKFGFAMKF